MKIHTAKWILFVPVVLMTACVQKAENKSGFIAGKRISELKEKDLREVSGLASSARYPGLFWAHNDSGHDAEVFLIDSNCVVKQVFKLAGIKNRDWEDISVGPGPDSTKNYVYVGDIGDNDGVYPLKFIYRFEEPEGDLLGEKRSIAEFDTIIFQLPNSRKIDTEAIFVDDLTRDIYIVTKREQPVYVYRINHPYPEGDTVTAEQVTSLPLTQIVAADLSSNGKELVMKNYTHIYYWNNVEGKPLEELLKQAPEEVPYQPEPQGESIAWARDDSGFYTISEVDKGQKSYLIFYGRR